VLFAGELASGCLRELGDAKACADWVAKKTGKTYWLPSESEFEYAAHGRTLPGVYLGFWFGNDEKELCKCGNFYDQKAGGKNLHVMMATNTHRRPGITCRMLFGLRDMFGNAWQRMEDFWHDNCFGAPADGSAWSAICGGRVVRSGASLCRRHSAPSILSCLAGVQGAAVPGLIGIWFLGMVYY
jgi:formylglycine-generating enzyme required for sulfatase activity